jgi:hypothetical protein
MRLVQITPQASSDIAKLAQGVSRTEVALEALKVADLNEQQVKQLQALLKRVAPTADPASVATSPDGGRFDIVDGCSAVVGTLSVEGKQLDTLLSEGSFNKSRAELIAYADKVGYRVATREENLAYVNGLLAKETGLTINEAEKHALRTYQQRYVRDAQGGIDVTSRPYSNRRVFASDHHCSVDRVNPHDGALFVRPSAQSK